ncbi:MAG: RNA polymerase sigma factor [Bacteroidales bacterium]|nr:RNA polymerase sigma factor [Bacteroidales bacterium]MBN2748303.1 RNA polymerase sigma factor [Bacteroidales bacterium]
MTVKEYNQSVDTFADNLYRFALKTLNDEAKAKDAVQDAFEKLWIKHADVSFEKVKSYLFTTVYHNAIDTIRRDKKQDYFDSIRNTEYTVEHNYSDLQEILHKAVNRLPEDQKSVVLLRDYEGYSYQEISEITGLNESQVKVYIYRARLFLKSYIGKMETVI